MERKMMLVLIIFKALGNIMGSVVAKSVVVTAVTSVL